MSKGSEILCASCLICRGCPRTESEIRPIYRTDDLIGEGKIQEFIVETWAKVADCWIDNTDQYLSERNQIQDYGTESTVFFNPLEKRVQKSISLKHYNVLRLALDRIVIHNATFPESALKVIGFGKNISDEFCVVVEQPYVSGDPVPEDDVVAFMSRLGFKEAGEDYGMHLNWTNGTIYIGDLNQFNVIKGAEGIHVIDADCRLNVQTLECGGDYVIPNFPNRVLDSMFEKMPVPAWM